MCTASSARRTWRALASASEYTATVAMPILRAVFDDAAGDLAAVGNQDLGEHRCAYIRNTPNFVAGIGAFSVAASERPSTRRVSAGSITPSSHSRALA